MAVVRRPWLLLPLVLLLAFPVRAGVELGKIIPADTKLAVRLDLTAARASKLGNELLVVHDAKIAMAKTFMAQVAGVDLDQVARLWVFSGKPDTGIFVFDGTFNPAQVQAHLAALPNMMPITRPGCSYVVRFRDEGKDRMMLGALINEQLLLVGDEPSVAHFLDALQGKVPVLAADTAQLQKFLADKHEFVLTMFGGPKDWPDFAKDDVGKHLASIINDIWLTGTLTGDAQLQLTITADTLGHAEGVEFLLHGLTRLMADSADVVSKPLLATLLRVATFTRTERTVTITSTVPGVDVVDASTKF